MEVWESCGFDSEEEYKAWLGKKDPDAHEMTSSQNIRYLECLNQEKTAEETEEELGFKFSAMERANYERGLKISPSATKSNIRGLIDDNE